MNRHLTQISSLVAVGLFFICLTVSGQTRFSDHFTDATLRLDYTFIGNSSTQHIALDELSTSEGWYGKRQHLDSVPMAGNGQLIARDAESGKVVYRQSFSTLFQEWLSYEEAKKQTRSFENVFLMPMPRKAVDVTVELRNNRQQVMTSYTQRISPDDILIRHIGEQRTPFTIVQQPADTTRCIRIAYVAEGYCSDEMDAFLDKVREANDALFAHEPFRSMRQRFQIVAVLSPSAESGTSQPKDGLWKNTALGSHFDTFYSNRYLTTLRLKRLHDWLAGIPYEHIIILVNTEHYGGGGILNSYNLAMTRHRLFRPVVVHEFGHSFAGLADEYAYENEAIPMYPADVEPWEPNITTKVDFPSKWADMMNTTPAKTKKHKKHTSAVPAVDQQQIGLYEGAGYSLKGVYRPCEDCRMRTNENPEFCPVCQRALQRVIDFYTL